MPYWIFTPKLIRLRSPWFAWMKRASSCWPINVSPSPWNRAARPKKITNTHGKGTRNLFVAVEPKGGRREVSVTARRTKKDFVAFVLYLLQGVYASARKVHLVVDNLNTHFAKSFIEVLGAEKAALVLARIDFHYTPKHASWLNMAEVEIGVMEKQCTGRRIPTEAMLQSEVAAWQQKRNVEKRGIQWAFTREKADAKMGRKYVS